MLYQPSFPKPYLTDIDATQENEFSCYINAEGGTAIIKYDLTISDLNGVQIYNSGVQNLANPVYAEDVLTMPVPANSGMVNGLDYTWKVALYESNPNIWVAYGVVQPEPASTTTDVYIRKLWLIKAGMYLKIRNEIKKITSYDAETGLAVCEAFSFTPTSGMNYTVYSDNVVSSDVYFSARTTPTLVLTPVPDTINGKSYTFTATYDQAEGVTWKYFQWYLHDKDGVIIDQTNRVDNGEIEFSYDGFFNGERYGISLLVENQDGTVLTTEIEYFNVSYLEPDITNAPIATVDCKNNAVKVTWSPPLINRGEASGTGAEPYYTIVSDEPFVGGSSVLIGEDNQIKYWFGSENNPVQVPYESTTYINWRVPSGSFSGVVYEQHGEYTNLLTMSTIAPAQCNVGDKYYNLEDGLVYTAIATNQWSVNGVNPDASVIYFNLNDNQKYLYNTQTGSLGTTDAELPSYVVSYDKGIFSYEIKNLDIDISGQVIIAVLNELWLLQTQVVDPLQLYVWDDNQRWRDNLYWTETTASTLAGSWFKLILLPTGLQVVPNEIPEEGV